MGQDYVVQYAVRRDQEWAEATQTLEAAGVPRVDLTFPEFKVLPPPHLFLTGCPAAWQEGYTTVAEARQAEVYRLLNRLLDGRALAKAAQISQYILQKELARDFSVRGGVFTGKPPVQTLTARQEFRAALSAVEEFAIGVASLAGERGIAINRVFSHFFTAKGAWAGMAWQFGSIYWQAARLKLKGAPFFTHPPRRPPMAERQPP